MFIIVGSWRFFFIILEDNINDVKDFLLVEVFVIKLFNIFK